MIIDEEIRKAILHDIKHKPFKKKHNIKEKELNTTADRDAANLSRYKKSFDNLTDDFLNLSFIFEKNFKERDRKEFVEYSIHEYIESKEPTQILHKKLLGDKIISNFNEVTSMPYTSLKYHTLLVCTLHYNYIKGKDFQDLYLNYAKNYDEEYAIIFKFDDFHFVIDDNSNGSHIGAPALYFGQTIGRLNKLPLPSYIVENLRRFRSWSIGLQYLEDVMIKLKKGGEL